MNRTLSVLLLCVVASVLPTLAERAEAQLFPTCFPGSTTLCLMEDFEVTVDWRDFQGNRGSAFTVPGASSDSGLFYFFSANNFEILVKVLDGCALTDHVWVFAAATTDVEYTLTVRDVRTNERKSYFNPLGRSAPAITDTNALRSCTGARSWSSSELLSASPRVPTEREAALVPGETADVQVMEYIARAAADAKSANCTLQDTALCLNTGRFQVEVEWTDFEGGTGVGSVVPIVSPDSGLFWFFDSANWEMLVKVINGCELNDRYWVFSAATTNVEYVLRVTDTLEDVVREYRNPLGQAAPAITDTDAFATCPGVGPGPTAPVIVEGTLRQGISTTTFSIDFTDPDGDMSENASYEWTASAGGSSCSMSTLGTATLNDGLSSGEVEVEIDGGGLQIPDANVTFQVKDAAGNLSNVFKFPIVLRDFSCPQIGIF